MRAGAVGAVLRDFQGTFIAASSMYIPNISMVLMAEVLAMKKGLSLANRLGYNVVEAKSDSTEVIEACKGDARWWNESSAILMVVLTIYVISIGKVIF